MPTTAGRSTGQRVRAALESAARQSRSIVADANARGDDRVREALAGAAEESAARRAALAEAHDRLAERTDRAESELREFARKLDDAARGLISKDGA